MNTLEKFQFIRDNVNLYYNREDYYLDRCDKCQKVILHLDSLEYGEQDGDFLAKCLVCNKKICNECCIETCSMHPIYCRDCKDPEKDLIECSNCKRTCFEYCTNDDEEGEMKVDGIKCCQHCVLDLFSEVEKMKKVKLIKRAS